MSNGKTWLSAPLPERTNASVFQQTDKCLQRRGYGSGGGVPKGSPAEGKAIFKLRHKVQMSYRDNWNSPPHRRSMPGPHKASALLCPRTLQDKAGRTREAQNKRRKSSIHKVKRQRLHAPKISTVSCFLCVFLGRLGANMRHLGKKKKHAWCVLSAVCHLRTYQQSESQGMIINMFEGNHESQPLGQEFLSVKAIPEALWILWRVHATYRRVWAPPLNPALVLTQRSHSFKWHNQIDGFKE